jgi:hypothetical protein
MATANKGAGRPAGSPNKSTNAARQAIATFVDGNAHRLTEWLDQVAQGVKVYDPETESDKYIVPPNPAKAFDMFQSVVEYHVPKLARMEVAGDPDAPVRVEGAFDIFDEVLKLYANQRQIE